MGTVPFFRPRAFTLVELLVTITIMGMLAAMTLGAMSAASRAGKEYATRATIAKLHNILMQRYESYLTRRVPISFPAGMAPNLIAVDRLYAIRDLMRMEMPDRQYDVISDDGKNNVTSPIALPNSGLNVPVPPITQLYASLIVGAMGKTNKSPLADNSAELLYMIVSLGSPESLEQFSPSEIGDVDGNGLPEFLDGWGRPISFLRWAPGCSSSSGGGYGGTVTGASAIQIANPATNHDPFDPHNVDQYAFQLLPLIYSGGPDGKLGIEKDTPSSNGVGYYFAKDKSNINNGGTSENIFTNNDFKTLGTPSSADGSPTDYLDNITNHDLGQ